MKRSGLFFFLALVFGSGSASFGQPPIFAPEGLNMPGTYNGFTNPPSNLAFAGIQVPGGRVQLNTDLPTRRYRTTVFADVSGGDVVGGTYTWLFTSGPSGGYFDNKWAGTTVTMNIAQPYSYNSGSDNSITFVNGKWYTMNWRDSGYVHSRAIWMETSAEPVTIDAVSQTPIPGSVTSADPVTVNITLSAAKAAEETLYVRYTTDNWVTSVLKPVTTASTAGSAVIPAQPGGTTVRYYAFSSTVGGLTDYYDMYTLNHNNNGGANYQYTVNAPTLTINASAGLNGSILPSGIVIVPSGNDQAFTITPDVGYFVDSVIVDGALTDSTTSYTFVNVTANHTIHATFTKKYNVTFRVNMNKKMQDGDFLPGSGDAVTVRGSFNDWGNSTNNPDTLDDGDADSIYVITKLLNENTHYEYKFWKTLRGGQDYENSISNRVIDLGSADTTLDVKYFNDEVPLSAYVDIDFQVDMSVKMMEGTFDPLLGDVVTVRGTFNDWGNSTNNPDTLTDGNGDSIYVGTVSLPQGANIQYKFWKNLRGQIDYENNISNRLYSVPVVDASIPAVYFDDDSLVGVYVGVGAGWNMISNPVTSVNDSVSHLYPNASFPYAFAFNPAGGYVQQQTMENGTGFWEKFPSAATSGVAGSLRALDSILVSTGWNMIGSISFSVDTSTVVQEPAGIVGSQYFGYSGSYFVATTISPGAAYWVKANAPGNLVLTFAGPEPANRAPMVHNEGPLSAMSTLTITDRSGAQQTLYVGRRDNLVLPLEMFELPPLPPSEAFDARFESGSMVGLIDNAVRLPIAIQSAQYPVTVSWDLGRHADRAFTLKNGETGEQLASVSSSGSVQIQNPSVTRLILGVEGAEIPATFALMQNFPNPFNPSTSIRYALPVDARVTVKVFDLLGREVVTLVDDVQAAGAQTLTWNGLNSTGSQVSSGIYMYRMEARPNGQGVSFQSTMKMLLLK